MPQTFSLGWPHLLANGVYKRLLDRGSHGRSLIQDQLLTITHIARHASCEPSLQANSATRVVALRQAGSLPHLKHIRSAEFPARLLPPPARSTLAGRH